MNFYSHRLASTFGYNALEEEERERRSLIILLVGLTCFEGLVYSLIFLSFGAKLTIYAILFYIIFSILNLTYYYNSKNYDEVKSIDEELYTNLEKINHQEKRADGLVKAMLQPYNCSSGQKVPIDLNALSDEYMRLAYHGLRPKDKSSIATTETNFEPNMPLVEAVPQDIGRILLNIITNAFHAVSDLRKKVSDEYLSVVKVGSGLKDNIAILYVQYNGYRITDQVQEKIFQPFFKTKPTGRETGLAFDTVKAHGGDIFLHTKVDKGTIFYKKLSLKN